MKTRSTSPGLKPVIAGVLILFVLTLPAGRSGWAGIGLTNANSSTATEKSIAVLPFTSQSAGMEHTRFLAEGIHDELLTALSRIRDLRVISRTSLTHYRNTTRSTREIAAELGVTHLLEGVVQQNGNRARISVQLIDAVSEDSPFSETWEGEITSGDIFEFEVGIASAVAEALGVAMPAEAGPAPGWTPTDHPGAFQSYLDARHFENLGSPESLHKAADHARKAVDLDPEYAQAHLALASILVKIMSSDDPVSEDADSRISVAIDNAIRLQPRNGAAYAVLGSYRRVSGRPGAGEAFETALKLDPGNFDALYSYGDWLRQNGKPDTALALLQQSRARDPLAPRVLFALGNAYLALEKYDQARSEFTRIREIEPSSPLGFRSMGESYIQQGNLDQALFWVGKALPVDPRDYELAGWMVFLNDCLEDYVAADEWSSWLDGKITKQPQPIAMQARHHYLTGKFELALQLSNLALRLDLPERWGSDAVFMRIKRDEALANGVPEQGIRVFEEHHPELFEPEPEVVPGNAMQAVDLAQLLVLAGRKTQAMNLLDAAIRYYDQPWSTSGNARFWLIPVKAEALAVMGDETGALEELRRIVDAGWKLDWRWETELNFNLNGIRKSPAFQAILGDLAARVTAQRHRAQALADSGEIPPAPPSRRR